MKYLARTIVVVLCVTVLSGYAFCQDSDEQVASQAYENSEAQSTDTIAAANAETKTDEARTAEATAAETKTDGANTAGEVAKTAEKVAKATSGASIMCGVGSYTLPGVILCAGVQAINLGSKITSAAARASENSSDSEVTESSYDMMDKPKGFWGKFFSLF